MPAQSNRVHALPNDPQAFQQHMSEVRVGWTERQLLDHAGEPREKLPDGWYYKSNVSDVVGGEYVWFKFKIADGVVSAIDKGHGEIHARPVPE